MNTHFYFFRNILSILGVFACIHLSAQNRLPSGSTFKDVVVATVQDDGEDFELRTNIYLPEENIENTTPLLIYIHGNGGAYNFASGSRAYELSIALSDRGIAVATVDYRPKAGLPDNIYDVKAYIRYFRANAEKYNIDPERIGIWGTSRGGNLATIIATTGDSKEHEGTIGGNLDQSSTIQYAVIYYPFITSLSQDEGWGTTAFLSGINPKDSQAIMEAYEKNDASSPYWKYVELVNLCNAVNHVDENDPPVFIAHGAIDRVTLVENSYQLYNKYVEMGVPAWLNIYSKGGHGTVSTDIEKASADWLHNMLTSEQ